MKTLLLLCLTLCVAACTDTKTVATSPGKTVQPSIEKILSSAKRIPTSSGWFEVLRLPNDVYALWEPGHVEKVNSYLIIGQDRDLLYDTGMGIDDIGKTITDLRNTEGLPQKPIQVVNSHNHLDHNGGNQSFNEVWTANHSWALKRLSTGVPAGEAGGFEGYWGELTPHPGVEAPASFSPSTHAIAPYPLEQVRFLDDNQIIDLGNRRFRVMRMFSHSPDGIALYDKDTGVFFGGDTFYGAHYLVTDVTLLANDLTSIRDLEIDWHYSSHGPQFVVAMQQGLHLATVQRIINGEGETGTTNFAGFELPMQALDGVTVTVAKDLLLY